jgi:glycogen debranching enzyme
VAADFRDLFDIRGMPRVACGAIMPPRVVEHGIVLGYRGLDDVVVETEIQFDQPHQLLSIPIELTSEDRLTTLPDLADGQAEPADLVASGAHVTFDLILAPGAIWTLRTNVVPRPAETVGPVAAAIPGPAPTSPAVSIETSDPTFNLFHQRSISDLDALQTSFPEGEMPAAGIPWYVAPFGRDSLIVGLQTLHHYPERAAGTLRVLAVLQGEELRPERGEEPGKILHEMRYGEMARLGEVPHTPYYGSVDATPLFVLLFAETIAWSGDQALFHEFLPNVRRAVEWIERYGDLDGDGLIEYPAGTEGVGHIRHQVWKDSWDSLHHTDGRAAVGEIAAVEVQGYVFAAYHRLAEVVNRQGDARWAAELRARAERMRQLVEERFWLPDEGYYAQALDGDKEPVRAISSNPGHLLFCGLSSGDRARALAIRLRQPNMASGWGVRTLSAEASSYNPMSYHNGSIWPHDNSLAAAGFYGYGLPNDGHLITSALFDAARSDPMLRLPELYCGFPREGSRDPAPVAYPVSCSPQAWAAGSAPLLLRSMLGLSVDTASRRLIVTPALPEWLEWVTISGLRVLGQTVSLTVRRVDSDYQIDTDGPVDRRLARHAETATA